MFYIVSGRFRLVESGIELPSRRTRRRSLRLFSSPSNTRAQTLECVETGTVLSVTDDQVEQLYVQNPAFGFHLRSSPAPACSRTSRHWSSSWRSIRRLRWRTRRTHEPVMTSSGETAVPDDDGLLASLRYLFADIIGDEDEGPPVLPDACPAHLGPAVSDAIHLMIEYQSTKYAQLYVEHGSTASSTPPRRRRRDAGRYRPTDGAAHGL